MTDLVQLKLSLPPDLIAYVQQQAAHADRTPSGVIRHWISERKRCEPPPEATFPAKVLASIKTAEEIAAAKVRLAALREERERLQKLLWGEPGRFIAKDNTRVMQGRPPSGTAADGARLDELNAEIDVLTKQIVLAERMLPPLMCSTDGRLPPTKGEADVG
jgi:hypothetical protein